MSSASENDRENTHIPVHRGSRGTRPVILDTADLGRLDGKVAMVSGGFDPLHDGHVAYFAAAHDLGLPVLCNITGDAYVARKHPPLLPQDRRARLIESIRYIAYAHVSDLSTKEVLEALRPKLFVKGRDWQGRLPAEELEACEAAGTEIVYLDTVTDSSTRLLELCLDRYSDARVKG